MCPSVFAPRLPDNSRTNCVIAIYVAKSPEQRCGCWYFRSAVEALLQQHLPDISWERMDDENQTYFSFKIRSTLYFLSPQLEYTLNTLSCFLSANTAAWKHTASQLKLENSNSSRQMKKHPYETGGCFAAKVSPLPQDPPPESVDKNSHWAEGITATSSGVFRVRRKHLPSSSSSSCHFLYTRGGGRPDQGFYYLGRDDSSVSLDVTMVTARLQPLPPHLSCSLFSQFFISSSSSDGHLALKLFLTSVSLSLSCLFRLVLHLWISFGLYPVTNSLLCFSLVSFFLVN